MKIHMKMIAALLWALLFSQWALSQDDVLDHPGFVNFAELNDIAGGEPSVEVSLKEPLLNMITNILQGSENEAAQFISTLSRVNVRVFDSSDIDTDLMAETMSAIANRLDQESWERVVRVRENREHVDVYFKLSDDATLIQGIAIMVTEPGETVLVNIVGDISPDDISAISQRFDIDELAEIDYNGRD